MTATIDQDTVVQVIDVSAGADEPTRTITVTDTTGHPIDVSEIQLSLGTAQAPGAWRTPDIAFGGTMTVPDCDGLPTLCYWVAAAIIIGGSYNPPPGTYWVWYLIDTGGNRFPRPTALQVRVT